MARPKKLTLDFFLHDADARHDRKIRSLRRKHGNDGYATYFCLLEMLCQEEGMKLDLSNGLDMETAAEECGLRDEGHLYKILDTCTNVGLFDRQLWESERIVFSHGLYNRYLKRLEDRKAAADRKQRSIESKKLQERINQVITRDNTVSTRDKPPELTELTELTELQNLRTLEPKKDQNVYGQLDSDESARDRVKPDRSEKLRQEEPEQGAIVLEAEFVDESSSDSGKLQPEDKYSRFVTAYNAGKPVLWAAIAVMNPKRKKVVDQLCKDCGGIDQAIAVLESALAYAKSDEWYSSRDLSFDNFSSNGKIQQLHERQMSRERIGVDAVAFVTNPANLKAEQRRQTIARALERF